MAHAEAAQTARITALAVEFLLTAAVDEQGGRLARNAEALRALVQRALELTATADRTRLALAAAAALHADEAHAQRGGPARAPSADALEVFPRSALSGAAVYAVGAAALVRLIHFEARKDGVFCAVMERLGREFDDYGVEDEDDLLDFALESTHFAQQSTRFAQHAADESDAATDTPPGPECDSPTEPRGRPSTEPRGPECDSPRKLVPDADDIAWNTTGRATAPERRRSTVPAPARPRRVAMRKTQRPIAGASWTSELASLEPKKLMDAVALGQLDVVERFIRRSLDPPQSSASSVPDLYDLLAALHPQLGYSALHAAVDFGQTAVAELLLRYGADADSRRCRLGQTPLHLAAKASNVCMVELLIRRGATPSLVEANMKRAYELVPENACRNLVVRKMRDSLKEVPWRLDGTAVENVTPRRFQLTWSAAPDRGDAVAETQFYQVDWVQTMPREESKAYQQTLRCHQLGQRFVASQSPNRNGTKKSFLPPPLLNKDGRKAHRVAALGAGKTSAGTSIKDLWPATRYVATVRAFNAAGFGPLSASMRCTTLCDVPDAPGEPFLIFATNSTLVVGWLPPRYDNGHSTHTYEVQRCVVGGSRAEKMRLLAAQPGMTQLKVRAACDALPQTPKPAGETSDDSNDWTTLKKKDWVTVRFAAEEKPTLCVPGLSPGDFLIVRVRACNAVEEGAEAPFSHFSRISEPLEARNSISVDVSVRTATVQWDAHFLKASKWELQLQEHRPGKREPWVLVDAAIPHASKISLVVESLAPGTRYKFRVRPCDADGWRSWDGALATDVSRTHEAAPDAPAAPTGLAELCTARQVCVCWVAGACNGQPLTVFEVQKLGDGGWIAAGSTSGLVSQLFVDAESPLAFRVRSNNQHGWSEWSPASLPLASCERLPPGAPDLVKAGVAFIELRWAPPPAGGVVKYVLQSRVEDDAVWSDVALGLLEAGAVIPDLKPARRYVFRVQALTLDGLTAVSQESNAFACRRRF
ncbi:fibronectin type III [Pelagophyceae sp. CCMP2097]|nr:fibronectin type III [Pelagophyceae sp. CCMP2097]